MFKRIAATAIATIAALTTAAVPAHASPVSVSGDTNWSITSQSSVSTNYPKLKQRVTATETLNYSARILGVPLPVTGYYILSFPHRPFGRPTLLSTSAPLKSRAFTHAWDSYMKKSAWQVSGQTNFWGNRTIDLKADAPVAIKASGYVHGGTGTGHSIDVNSIDYVSVK